jgi:ribosomal protein S18 acetylase RimI-like enzyme
MLDTLARAFEDDPIIAWAYAKPGNRLEGGRRFFGSVLRQFLPHDESFTTDDHAGGAIWAIPGAWHLSVWNTIRLVASTAPLAGPRGLKILKGLQMVEEEHPKGPEHYYLSVLGTEPARQGQGIGSALLQPVLESCDRDEIAAYLETGKERNIAFYNRHGFKVTKELRLPDGPPVWLMWRDPRP